MTTAEAVERAYLRIAKGQPQKAAGLQRKAIEAGLSAALQRLADRVAGGPNCALLQKAYSLTFASGAASLASNSDLLIETIPGTGHVTHSANTNAVQWLRSRTDLDTPPPLDDYYFGAVFADAIYVVDSTGTAAADGTLSLTANYVPALAQVPAQLGDNVIDILVELTLEAPGGDYEAEAATPTGNEVTQ